MKKYKVRLFFAITLLFLSIFTATASDDLKVGIREFSIGLLFTSQSNVFQEYGTTTPDRIASFSGDLLFEFRLSKKSYLIPGIKYRSNQFREFDSASYPEILAGLEFKHGRHRLSLEISKSSDRLLYISSEYGNILYDRNALYFSYKGKLSPRFSLKLQYRREKEVYREVKKGRDMTSDGFRSTFYVNVQPSFSPFIGLGWIGERAQDSNYSHNKPELWLGASIQINSKFQIYTRYKIAWKNYLTKKPSAWNFERHDTQHGILIELKIPLYYNFMLIFKDYYKKGISTRQDRNFSDNQFGFGAKFIF
jgi:hypothetical protein